MKNNIRLLINRKWEDISTENILYITISDKLSFLYLSNGVKLNLFITLSELEQQLPKTDFIRISRNSIVNYSAIRSIKDAKIYLVNEEALTYSKRREKSILIGFQQYQHRKAAALDLVSADYPIDFAEVYKAFDDIPIPFAVLEMTFDDTRHCMDLFVRYANQAAETLLGKQPGSVVGRSIQSVFKNSQAEWARIYPRVAYDGEQIEMEHCCNRVNKVVHIQCFQHIHGYCCCMVTDIEEKKVTKETTCSKPGRFTKNDISQRFLPLLNALLPVQLDALERFLETLSLDNIDYDSGVID